jgi:hypothetical protein
MAGHSSEKRWTDVSAAVSDVASRTVATIVESENIYQDLIELWAFAGSTDQLLADQLFFEVWSVRESDPVGDPGVFDTEANAAEVAQVTDAKAAALAAHELFQALTDVAVAQKDRITTLRRMT